VSAFRLCGALLSCSLALIIAGASRAPLALLSGLAFGITYNLVVAIQVIWSDEVFARRPSAGLPATMLMFALRQILGPTLAGIVVDRTGVSIAFGLAAGVMALNLILAPPRTQSPGITPAIEDLLLPRTWHLRPGRERWRKPESCSFTNATAMAMICA
jgi:MFS family permease